MESNPILDFYDIYEYYSTPYWQKPWFYVSAIFLVGLLIGLLVFYIWFKRRHLMAPWDWAFNELARLSKKSLQTKDDIKRYYFELTRIIWPSDMIGIYTTKQMMNWLCFLKKKSLMLI